MKKDFLKGIIDGSEDAVEVVDNIVEKGSKYVRDILCCIRH